MHCDDRGPARAEVGHEKRAREQHEEAQQLPLSGAAGTQLRCSYREDNHLSGFEYTNDQWALEDPEYVWPPGTVKTAVDAADLERGRFHLRDAGRDEQRVMGHHASRDLVSDIDGGGSVETGVPAVCPDRLLDVECGEI